MSEKYFENYEWVNRLGMITHSLTMQAHDLNSYADRFSDKLDFNDKLDLQKINVQLQDIAAIVNRIDNKYME